MSSVRTRFAPSPTGSLHVGNARIAVLNWLIARHHGGEFILRIEDTDVERNVEGAEQQLLEDLAWLGLQWDEGPAAEGERGPHRPYRQSERRELYARQADQLLRAGAAYRCFCTVDRLERERERALAEGRNPGYGGTCRELAPSEAEARSSAGEASVIRLATPQEGDVVVNDAIRGRVVFDAAEIGDFVLVRSDGVPTYNFAVVVDDAEMEVTHVIRGAGHLSNTPHQLMVYDALDIRPPAFAHAPTVLGEDRRKLSKRTGAPSLRELRERGVHPDAVVNYLSLLGWSSLTGEEVLGRDRLVEEVTLERVNAADVVFDAEKLGWMSAKHIERMSLEELASATRPWVQNSRFGSLLADGYMEALDAVRSRISAFGEVVDHLAPFVGVSGDDGAAPPDPDQERVLEAVRARLGATEGWDPDGLQQALREAGSDAGARGRDLYVPVRRALTGEDHGPPLTAVLRVQGRDRVLDRLDRVLERRSGRV